MKNNNKNQRLWLALAGVLLLVLLLVAVLSSRSSDPAPSATGPASSDQGQSAESSPVGYVKEITEGPPLQELPVYTALKGLEGYVEQARQATDPPVAAAVRFGLDDQDGFFWLSLLDENTIHYIDPANDSPAYNKKLYSMPVIGRSCYMMLTDDETFIIRHIVDTPPTTEDEIAAGLNNSISLLVGLGSAGVEGVGSVVPTSDTEIDCWDLTAS